MGCLFNGLLLFHRKPGGADDQMHTLPAADRKVLERAFRASEINQAVGLAQGSIDVGADGDAARTAHQLARILADKRAPGMFQRGNQFRVRCREHSLNQGSAHASGASGNGESNTAHDAYGVAGVCVEADLAASLPGAGAMSSSRGLAASVFTAASGFAATTSPSTRASVLSSK